MDDKKINLMPDDMRSKEDQTKRAVLKFNPDFKLAGKKEKTQAIRESGSQGSWWSRTFKKEKKEKVLGEEKKAPVFMPSPNITYNDESKTATIQKVDMPLHVPESKKPMPSTKVEEHIQEFVPADAKIPKAKGPSFWSRIFGRKKKKMKDSDSALSNGLKYNGNGDLHQPEKKADLKVLQELNKQAEDSNNMTSLKKTPVQVSERVEPEITFDLTKKVEQEINLQPIEPVVQPKPAPVETSGDNGSGFAIPELKPSAPAPKPNSPAPLPSPQAEAPKKNGAQFHLPERNQKNGLITGGVDLIPAAARVRSWKQIGSLLFFATILSLLILGVIYGYLVYDQQRIITKQNEQKQQIAEIEKSILDFSKLNKNISQMGEEIKLVQEALNKHIYWTKFFALLEKYTVKDVYYSGLSAGTNGGLTLSATTFSYDSVAKQLKVLNSLEAMEFVLGASITSAKQDKDGQVSFQIILILNPTLFYYSQNIQ